MWHLDMLGLRRALEKGLEGHRETEDGAGGRVGAGAPGERAHFLGLANVVKNL